jgi:hypothetical protein
LNEEQPQPDSSLPALSRSGLEDVIRRAVELSLKEADASEQISEAEVIRIAEELGLSERHVRQALYERPVEEREPTFLDKHFGPESVTAARPVACETQIANSRLEDYLVTREYLQIRRRQGGNAYFEPAEDAFSSIARAFSRPSHRFHIARAQRAYLTVRTLEPGWCHVRLEMNYEKNRKDRAVGAWIMGGFLGVVAGLGAGAIVFTGMDGGLTGALAMATGLVTGGGVFAGIWTAMKADYQKLLGRSREEAEALLDRLQHGETLQPPSSPWMRRLQQRLRGFGSRGAAQS